MRLLLTLLLATPLQASELNINDIEEFDLLWYLFVEAEPSQQIETPPEKEDQSIRKPRQMYASEVDWIEEDLTTF